MRMVDSKICLCCKQIFVKSASQSSKYWENRKYCSVKCSKLKIPIEEYKQEKLKFILSQTITTESGCMEWQGCIHRTGYGIISFFNKQIHVHRLVYILINGELSKETHVLHSCDNRKCCNENHFFLGTNLDNIQDKVNKGRQAKGFMNPFCKLSEQDRERIIQLAKEGIFYTYIAKEFNVDRTTINEIAINNGIRRRSTHIGRV